MRVSLVLALALLSCSSSPDTGLFGAAEVTGSGGESASSGGAQTGGTAPLGTGGSTATGGAVGTGGFAIAPGWTETGGTRTTGPFCGVDGNFCAGGAIGSGGAAPAPDGGGSPGSGGASETGGMQGSGGTRTCLTGQVPCGENGKCVGIDYSNGCGDSQCRPCTTLGAYALGSPTCTDSNGLSSCDITCVMFAHRVSQTVCQ